MEKLENSLLSEALNNLNQWVREEREKGVPNPQHAILSTATQKAIPHARIVGINEITENGLLFFTQQGTRKVYELTDNPIGALTFWFEFYERQVIIEGEVRSLSDTETKAYWHASSRESQLRFHSYVFESSDPITTKQEIERRKSEMEKMYTGKPIPLSPFYCGFRLKPKRILFYDCGSAAISDVIEYQQISGKWEKQLLSPYAIKRIINTKEGI